MSKSNRRSPFACAYPLPGQLHTPEESLEPKLDEDFRHPGEKTLCVAGVSGGPDSMALLALLVKYGWKPVVCHVNYHKRDTANRDEQIVREFCSRHQLQFRLLNPVYQSGNFQGWARDVRMAFFEETARQLGNVPIFLAHQQDDVLETYILQKKRNILCDFYGIQKITVKNKQTYIRPLLRLSKKELENYTRRRRISWGLDESNLSDTYLRNQVRHQIVEPMSETARQQMLAAMDADNAALSLRRENARRLLETKAPSVWLQHEDAGFVLEYWFFLHTNCHLAASQAADLVRQLQHNVQIPLKSWQIERWNDQLFIHRQADLEPEAVIIDSLDELQALMEKPLGSPVHPFVLKSEGRRIESVTVSEEDFPLRLEPARDKDFIDLRYGRKKAARIYVDQKVPHYLRKTLFLVKNRANKVIFVPRTGCANSHFSPNPTFYMVES